jgi:FKBP-type peptidyl-prolyl cis-trans isomerase
MIKEYGQRVFAFTMAFVFLFTAVAFSAFVIYDMHQTNQKNKDQQAALAAAKAKSSQGKALANFSPVKDVPALVKTDQKEGTGDEAKAGDTVTVDYTGAVAATGKIFESSKDTGQPATLSLDSVIDGWKQGIPGMKIGGSRRLLIPAQMAYGPNPPQGSSIPANAALVFDVTLVKVEAKKSSASSSSSSSSSSTESTQPSTSDSNQ